MMIPARILIDFFQVIERTLVNMIGGRALKNADDLFQTCGLPEQSRITLAVKIFADSAQPRPDILRFVLLALGKLFDLGAFGNVARLCRRLNVERRDCGDAWRTCLQSDGCNLVVVDLVPEKPQEGLLM